jgi:putative lipoic acid-binding regulatory protein
MQNKDEFYSNLKTKLDEFESWPSVYMFKFIVPGDLKNVAEVEGLFNTKTSKVSTRQSSTGKFISITAKEVMVSSEAVVAKYREAEHIEGLMSL